MTPRQVAGPPPPGTFWHEYHGTGFKFLESTDRSVGIKDLAIDIVSCLEELAKKAIQAHVPLDSLYPEPEYTCSIIEEGNLTLF